MSVSGVLRIGEAALRVLDLEESVIHYRDRIGLQEMARENSTLKERSRDLLKRMQEIEHLLDSAQKNHEKDRNELMATTAKLRELNLRYNSALTDLNHQRNQNQKYADNLEDLIEENKRLQRYKIQVDTANEQIVQLKKDGEVTNPGWTEFTRMFSVAYCSATDFVARRTDPFEAW